MIVFLYGPDSYRRIQRRRFYRDQFEKKYSKPARAVDLAEEGALDRLAGLAASGSLFGGKDLFITENAFEAEPKKLLPILQAFADDKDRSLLISEDGKPVKALGMLLKKPVVAEEIDHPEGAAWTTFIKKEAATRGVELDPQALSLLAAVYRKNSWGLATELERLSAFGRIITRSFLEESGLEEPEGNYWALVNGLRSERYATRLSTLETLLAMGEPPAKIFNILAPLWTTRIREFAEYDRLIKTGKLEYEEALADAVLGTR